MRKAFFAAVFVSAIVASIAAQDGVAGNWNIAIETPQGTREVTLKLAVDGETLTGTMSSQQGETNFKGTAKGNTFNFTMDVNTPNGAFNIGMTGEVTGDDMKGTMDFGGMGSGGFTGKRQK